MATLFFNWRSFLVLTLLVLGTTTFSNAQCPTAAAVLTKTHTNVSCFGANDGTITVELGDGNSPLNFELYDNVLGDFVTFSVSETNDPDGNGNLRKVTYSDLYPSSYQVVVFKAGCPTIQISGGPTGFVIEEPASLAVTLNTIDPDCNPASGAGSADGSIQLTITGGRTPYDISWPTAVTSISSSTGNSDPFVVSPSSLDGGSYTINVTDASGCTASLNIDVPIATVPDAGPDQTLCDLTSATLAANAAGPGEVGRWTLVSGTGIFADDTNPTTTVSGLTVGAVSTFQWTITDDNTPALCPGNSDQVNISVESLPTVANAGGDQALCSNTTTLAGNTPMVGSGSWSIVSGAGGSFANPADPASSFTGTAGTSYTLRWTITNGSCPPSEDDVVILFDASPTVANAGTDQVVCATSTALVGNSPVAGTGVWTIVSGVNGVLANPASPNSGFSGEAGQSYVLRWTISNGTCPSSQDDVSIQFDEPPTNANAGANRNICGNSVTLAGNTPTVGTGLWTIVSGGAGAFGDTSSPTSTFTGTQGATYRLRWTITNGTCPVETDDVIIRFALPPTTADAGDDQQVCATTTTLAGNTPTSGTGTWTIISGAGGNIANPSSPTSTFTGVAGNTYTLRWRIANNPCPLSDDAVIIRFDNAPTTANAGSDQVVCSTNTTLEGNTAVSGTGLWSIVNGAGGAFVDASNPQSAFSGLAGVTYELQWSIGNGICPASTDNVLITFDGTPTVANAGTDQTLCGVTSASLSANSPTVGTGAWTIESGAGGAISDPSDPAATFTGAAGTTYVLRWTISNGSCTPSFDEISIIFESTPTSADAGFDQIECATSTVLQGNAPVSGSGVWSIVSGNGGSITTPSSPNSGFTGVVGETYELQWTISNGSCAPSSDVVQIQFLEAPSAAVAGDDQELCNVGTTTLAATAPTVGTGQWTIISGTGGALTDSANPTSGFTGDIGSTYTLEWTITNGVCTPETDQVIISFDALPSTADAGVDQDICGTSFALSANTPSAGNGQWSIVSGAGGVIADPASPTSNFSGSFGETYILEWTISNGVCAASSDQVQVRFFEAPTIADAGTDQDVCSTSVALNANSPTSGVGAWTIQSGNGGNITDPSNPASAFDGVAGETYVLVWTITNGSCPASTDEVSITLDNNVTVADAGTDLTGCDPGSVTLSGNTPNGAETGSWTIVTGNGGSFNDPSLAMASFAGSAGETYTLRWTISNGTCETFDEVEVQILSQPAAMAGNDQTVCGSATLEGNTPASGTGLWTVISGAGGTFVDPANPATSFSGTPGTTYELQWTVTSGACVASDNVSITIDGNSPPAANAGADQEECGVTTVTLSANDPSPGVGQWTIISGSGGSFADPNDPATSFSGTAGETYDLQWTISNGVNGCAPTFDIVQVAFPLNPVSNAGNDQAVCGTSTTLNAVVPVDGAGQWTIVSGNGGLITDIADPASGFTGTAGETYTLFWIVTNACGSSSDNVIISFNSASVTADAGTDQSDVCGIATLDAQIPANGTGTWTIVAGAGGNVVDPADPSSPFIGTAGSSYTLRWTVNDGGCTAFDEVTVSLHSDSPSLPDAGPDQGVCGASTTLAAVTPVNGTGSWAIISGTGAVLADASAFNSGFSGLVGQTYELRWRVSTSCGFLNDTVLVTFIDAPTADAGADQTDVCGPTALAGIASNGTVSWTIVSGNGGSITDPADAGSTFSGLAGETYTLRMTVSNQPFCSDATDEVVISFSVDSPTIADAGPDQNVCGTTATLAANSPIGTETGAWIIVSGNGGSVSDAASPTSGFNGLDGETYVLRWSISSAAPVCNPSTDHVTIVMNSAAPVADAGADQTVCGALAQVNASGSSSAGVWSVISGGAGSFADPSSAVTDFTGTTGSTYVLRYTITSACGDVFDDVTVTLEENPTPADAGVDQLDVCGTVVLDAQPVFIGTGSWSIVAGNGGSIADVTDPTSIFNGTPGESYTLRWTSANGTCSPSEDDVIISINSNSPTAAAAGADQAFCGASVTLAANTPVAATETGSWTVVSGNGGSFADNADPVTQFNGTAGTNYILRWTITSIADPTCATFDDVAINLEDMPSAANAGPDDSGCSTSFTLAAEAPVSGTGTWSIVSGTGGAFDDVNDPATTFTGVSGAYTLEWIVSNTCGSSVPDQVVITIQEAPSASNAGPDQVICGAAVATLAANSPAVGTGSWAIVGGNGGSVVTPANASSQFIGIVGSSYTLRWIVANGTCTPSFDDVIINFAAAPVATSPVVVCQNSTAAALTVSAPGATSFNWYYYTDPSDPATRTLLPTTVSSHTPGAELNTAVVGSLTYEVEAVYSCGNSTASQIVVNVSNTGSCGNGGTGCFAFVINLDDALTHRPTCSDQDDGHLAVDVSGYAGKYEVSLWSAGVRLAFHVDFARKFEFPNLSPGLYELRVEDELGNSCVREFNLPVETTVVATSATIVNSPCFGQPEGVASLNVTGGNSPYDYSVDGGATWVSNYVSGNEISGLPVGSYNILVRDDVSDLCPAEVAIVIGNQFPEITYNVGPTAVSACNEADGKILVSNINGGSGTREVRLLQVTGNGNVLHTDYQIANGDVEFEDLSQGAYVVEVRDGAGCVVSNVDEPTTISAPGAVNFTVTRIADADCTKQGKSGVISIEFASPGNYQIGISGSQVIEPAVYVPYTHNAGDQPIFVDTLSRGSYFVFVKPQAGAVCASTKPTGEIQGAYAISFSVQRVCGAEASPSINLINVVGQPNAQMTIEVYRASDLSTLVDQLTVTTTEVIPIVYQGSPSGSPHTWLIQADDYILKAYQNQAFCPGEKEPSFQIQYSVTNPMILTVENIRQSLPEPRQTGAFTLRTVTGGSPFQDEDRPYFVATVYDPSSNTAILDPLKVYRNAQGNYEFVFRNLPVGNYELVVNDANGCEVSTLVIVPADTRIFVPNVFTPNADQANDQFEVLNLPEGGNHKLVITNRWGKQIFSSGNYREGSFWDAEGEPDGIYFYRLQVEGDKTYTGWVEVIRGDKP